eukprot:209332-Rhodomonas_salina.1
MEIGPGIPFFVWKSGWSQCWRLRVAWARSISLCRQVHASDSFPLAVSPPQVSSAASEVVAPVRDVSLSHLRPMPSSLSLAASHLDIFRWLLRLLPSVSHHLVSESDRMEWVKKTCLCERWRFGALNCMSMSVTSHNRI